MTFLQNIVLGLILAFSSQFLLASETNIQKLEQQIKIKEVELNEKISIYTKNEKAINKAISQIKQQKKYIDVLNLEVGVLKEQIAKAKNPVQTQSKIGEKPDDVPCTCVFNKNRIWNPEKVLWNNAYWKCSIYKDDGTCSEVKKIKDIIIK